MGIAELLKKLDDEARQAKGVNVDDSSGGDRPSESDSSKVKMPEFLQWQIDGVDYEFVTAREAVERRDGEPTEWDPELKSNRVEAITRFTNGLAEATNRENKGGEAALFINDYHFGRQENVYDEGGSYKDTVLVPYDDYACIIAKKAGRIVGVLTFETPVPNYRESDSIKKVYMHGRRHTDFGSAHLDRGVVARDSRRDVTRNEQGKSVSENLMRLSLSVILSQFKTEKITAEPVSKRGEGYNISNGLRPTDEDGGEGGKIYKLDERVVQKAKDFLAQLPEGTEMNEQNILELKDFIDTTINEVAREIRAEVDAERMAGEDRKL